MVAVAGYVSDKVYCANCMLQEKVYDTRWFQRALVRYGQIPMPGYANLPLAEVLHYLRQGFGQGRVWQRAKGLAYSLLMALPPLMIFLFTLVAYLPLEGLQEELLGQLSEIVPDNLYDRISLVVDDVMGHKHGSLMSIGFVASIFLATNGIYGCLMSMNYNNDTVVRQNFFVRYGICIFLVFLLFILFSAAMGLLVGYKLLLKYLMTNNWIAPTKLSMFVFSFGRWIILIVLTLLVLTMLYRFAVSAKQRKLVRFFSVGSVLATLLFFALTWLFQIYLNKFNQYNLLYGSIGTILVIMLWLFANCYVMLLGYEVNTSVIRSRQDVDQWRSMRREQRDNVRARRAVALRKPIAQPRPSAQKPAEVRIEEVTLNMEMTLRREADGTWKSVNINMEK